MSAQIDRSKEFQWTDWNDVVHTGRNQLTERRHAELQAHVRECPKPLKRCKECWMLYWNIGTDAWNSIMIELGGADA